MITDKKLGIWMDHANAHIMEFTPASPEATISSKFTHAEKEASIGRGEKLMHNKEKHEESEYYKRIGDVIKDYDEVILFGPTDAKVELYHVLRADHHFEKIKITTQQTDRLTENQQHAFVKDFFKGH